jgi:hypothetical protein
MAIRGAIARNLLGVPGGIRLLAGVRLLYRGGRAAVRLVRHPVRTTRARRRLHVTPWKDYDWAVLTKRIDEERPFLNSNRLAGRCRYVFKQDGTFLVHEDRDNNWFFCKTDDVHQFFAGHAPVQEFVLFTGMSDLPVDRTHRRYLDRDELKAWFAMNPLLEHPKLRARPIGIGALATREDSATLRGIQDQQHPKLRLFHCAFNVEHNPFERAYCLRETGVPLDPPREWPEYLEALASSYFCISPNGMGIDCVRTWEALLLRTVPVVRRSLVPEHHADFPMIVLDDWAQFRTIDFSPELYKGTWNDWDPDELLLDRYLGRVERILNGEPAAAGRLSKR